MKNATYQASKTVAAMTWDESESLIFIDYAARELRTRTDNFYRGVGR